MKHMNDSIFNLSADLPLNFYLSLFIKSYELANNEGVVSVN
jgi:hypothetical protein